MMDNNKQAFSGSLLESIRKRSHLPRKTVLNFSEENQRNQRPRTTLERNTEKNNSYQERSTERLRQSIVSYATCLNDNLIPGSVLLNALLRIISTSKTETRLGQHQEVQKISIFLQQTGLKLRNERKRRDFYKIQQTVLRVYWYPFAYSFTYHINVLNTNTLQKGYNETFRTQFARF